MYQKKKEGRQVKSVWGRPTQADSRIRGVGASEHGVRMKSIAMDVTGKVEAMAQAGYLAL